MENQREKDIQAVCNAVILQGANWEYNPNGYDAWHCKFCYAELMDNDQKLDTPEALKQMLHKQDCAYLIAKDLSTNYQPLPQYRRINN